MAFFQTAPELGNTFRDDAFLASYLARQLPEDVRRELDADWSTLGEVAGGELYRQLLVEFREEPKLVSWNAWGQRVEHIELTPLWKRAKVLAAEYGLVATAYERRHGEHSRIDQFLRVYLLDPSTAVYSCPLAMTDGAARTLLASGNTDLVARAVPRLTSRDPARAWTSGQWMTERTGGSDVAISESRAVPDPDGRFRLYGTKWFTSATTSEMALTLARPEGNPPGSSGLAMFYVETRDERGQMNCIALNRLKDKLGTRMVPTAELTLDGALATPVRGTRDGIKQITPMLGITRTWNAICAAAGMRRGMMLAKDYAKKRVAFGALLADKPLHVETLATLEAETQGAFLLAFRAVELIGREEAGVASDDELALSRLLTPIVKLTTGKQGVAVLSEVLEAFGGAGYVEDTGLPRLLRDAQVLPIWEGTTNVLSLDVLRALRHGTLAPVRREFERCLGASDGETRSVAQAALTTFDRAERWLFRTFEAGPEGVEAGARRFALSLGRALEAALLAEHGAWCLAHGHGGRSAAAARRFLAQGIDLVRDDDTLSDARLLAE